MWARDGSAWAVYRVESFSTHRLSRQDRLARQARLREVLTTLPAGSRLLSVCRPVDPGAVVGRMRKGVDLAAHPAWEGIADQSLATLTEREIFERRNYLAMKLPPVGWQAMLRGGRSAPDTTGTAGPIPGRLLQARRRQAAELEAELRGLAARRVSGDELLWLHTRAVGEDTDDSAAHRACLVDTAEPQQWAEPPVTMPFPVDWSVLLTADPTLQELQAAVVYSLAAGSASELEGRVAELQSAVQPHTRLRRPSHDGAQAALLAGMAPGGPIPRAVREHARRMTPGGLAASTPLTGVVLGNRAGMLLGHTRDGCTYQPVLLDPAWGAIHGRPGSIGIVGAQRQGKSHVAKLLAYGALARGDRVVVIDRTATGEYARLAAISPGTASVVRFDPADVGRDDLAETLREDGTAGSFADADCAVVHVPDLPGRLLHRVMAVVRSLVLAGPHRFSVQLLDDASPLLSSPQGMQLVLDTARDYHQHNAALWLLCRSAEELGDPRLAGLLGARLAFRPALEETPSTLAFLGLDEDDPDVLKLLGRLRPGQCLLRDQRGRLGMVEVLEAPTAQLRGAFGAHAAGVATGGMLVPPARAAWRTVDNVQGGMP